MPQTARAGSVEGPQASLTLGPGPARSLWDACGVSTCEADQKGFDPGGDISGRAYQAVSELANPEILLFVGVEFRGSRPPSPRLSSWKFTDFLV